MGISGGFDGFYDAVGDMNTALNIPANLTALGVKDPDLDRLTASALEDPSCGGNPIELTAQNTRALLESCF